MERRRGCLGSMAGKISPEKILEELAAIAFARVPDYMVQENGQIRLREDLKPRQRAAIASVESGGKVKFYDKMKALELLGKYMGMFEGKPDQEEAHNNLLEAILAATQEEVELDDIPEIQQTADACHDLVEPTGTEGA